MPQLTLKNVRGSWYTCSFASGYTQTTPSKHVSEDDAIALALWLERHGREDDALIVLERFCAGYRELLTAPP